MRLRCLLALMMLVALADSASAEEAGGPARESFACPAGKEVARSAQARMLKRGHRLIACLPSRNETWTVWSWSPPQPRFRQPVLVGSVLAFELRGTRAGTHSIDVLDVVTRKTCYSSIIGTGHPPFPNPGEMGELLRDVAITRTASFAYIAGPGSGPRDPVRFPDVMPWGGYEVVVVDQAGMRQVGAGTDIDPDSLRLVGGTVTWDQGGEPKIALIGAGQPCADPLLPGQGIGGR